MGIISELNAVGNVAQEIPPEEPGLLSSLTSPIFDLLDVPQNILKAGILAIQQQNAGDTEAAKEALMTGIKTLIPFVPARHIEASEITGSDDFWKNLGFDLVVDPLNAVSGVGGLTKVGKAIKQAEHLRNEITILTKHKEFSAAAESTKKLETLLEETGQLEGQRRYIAKLGVPFTDAGIEIGNLDAVGKKIKDTAIATGMYDDGSRKLLEVSMEKNLRSIKKDLDKAAGDEVWYRGSPSPTERLTKHELITGKIWGSSDPKFAEDYTGGVNSPWGKTPSPNITPFKMAKDSKILRLESKEYSDILDEVFEDMGVEGKHKERLLKQATGNDNWRFWESETLGDFEDPGLSTSVLDFVKSKGYDGLELTELGTKNLVVLNGEKVIAHGKPDFISARFGELLNKQRATKELLAKTPTLGWTAAQINKIRDIGRNIASKFKHSAKNDFVETLLDVTRSREAKLILGVDADKALMINRLEKMAKAQGISEVAQLGRLLEMAELRHLKESGATVEKIEQFHANRTAGKLQELAVKHSKTEAKIAAADRTAEQKVELIAKLREKFDNKIKLAKAEGEISKARDMGFLQEADKITPEEWEFVGTIDNLFREMPNVEKQLGYNTDPLNVEKTGLSYVKRLMSDDAKKLQKKDPARYNLALSAFNAKLGSSIQRTIYPEKTILEINKLLREDFKLDFDFFNTNIVDILTSRRIEHVHAVERARAVHTFLEEFAQKGIDLSGVETVKFKDFMRKVSPPVKRRGKTTFTGLDPNSEAFKKYKNLRLPAESVRDFLQVDEVLRNSIFNNAPNLNKVMNFADKVNNVYKSWLTVPFPSFHIRNAISNMVLNKVGDVGFTKQLAMIPRVSELQRKAYKGLLEGADKDLWEEMLQHGVINRGQFYEILKAAKATAPSPGGPLGKLDQGMDYLRKKGGLIEDHARITHYLAKREAGATAIEAARSMNKHLFDYSKVTNFERQFMRPSFLFYTWMRNNIPLMIRTSISDPRTVAVYENLTGMNHDEVPGYLKGARGFSVGGGEIIGGIGLPFEDLNLLNIQDADPVFFEQVKRLASKVLSKTSPVFKTPVELIKGETLFTNRKLDSLNTLEIIENYTPAGRVVREGEKILDPDEAAGFKMLDLLTGVKTYKVDPNKVKIDKLKRAAIKSGKFERSGFLIIPRKRYKDDPATDAQYKELQKQIRALHKKDNQ